jgi:hypothetical protein
MIFLGEPVPCEYIKVHIIINEVKNYGGTPETVKQWLTKNIQDQSIYNGSNGKFYAMGKWTSFLKWRVSEIKKSGNVYEMTVLFANEKDATRFKLRFG